MGEASSGKLKHRAGYKDSGVAWLGQVPDGWHVERLKTVASLVTTKATESTFPVALENIEGWTGRFLETTSEFQSEGTAFRAGDVLFGKLRPYLAKAWLADRSGEAVGDIFTIRPGDRISGEYLRNVLLTPQVISMLDGSTFGSKMPRVGWDFMSSLRIPIPPVEETEAICRFVGRESDAMDRLIAKQERLIDLLTEKRQSVISHAVRNGLNPGAALRDSGVADLGEIPAHWTVTPLMWLTPDDRSIMYGIVLPGPSVDEGIPIVKGGDVKPHRLRRELLARTTKEIEAPYARARLKPNDIVFAIRGGVGDAELVPEGLEGANITQDVARVSPRPGVDPHWLLAALQSTPVFRQIERRITGATIRGINIWDLKRAQIPVPPPHEAVAIAAHIRAETAQIDALLSKCRKAVELLREHRASLISAVVTGKIRVTENVPAAEELLAA